MKYEINPRVFRNYKTVSCDTEYTELNIHKAKLLSVSIGVSESLTYIFDTDHLSQVQEILNNAETIYAWNMTVDWYMLSKSGLPTEKLKWVDGMLLEHLIDERLDHGLGDFALRDCDDNYKSDFWSNYETYQEAPKEVQYEYEMRDGCYTYKAGIQYEILLGKDNQLAKHVHRLQWALFETEIKGLEVNLDLIKKTKLDMSNKISDYLRKLREEHHEYCQLWELQKWSEELSKRSSPKGKLGVIRPVFSFTSDKQLNWLVYDALECPVTEKTKKGNPKVDVETLQRLSETYPQLKTLADYKQEKSVYATFVDGMLGKVDGTRIYPRFNVNGTTTGRLSHSNPNMANLPRDGVIRNFFLPDPRHCIIGADYSQLEVVIEANLTEDKSLLKIILEGASKHDITAEGLGISRDAAKTLNFALQYGAGVHKVSKILGISNSAAEDIFNRYWILYRGVKALKDRTSRTLKDSNKVTNMFGRTRHFDEPKNEFERAKFERQAYNHLIQGVGADMTNMASYMIAEFLKANDMGRLWFSVHDEIVCEIRNDWTEEAKQHIVRFMGVPNETLKLKYSVDSKLYGPFNCWSKG